MTNTSPTDSEKLRQFHQDGYCVFGADEDINHWLDSIEGSAFAAISDPAHQHWWRYQKTWFVGVNTLNNDGYGRVNLGPKLRGRVIDFIVDSLGEPIGQLDRAQISAIYPGYPMPSKEDSPASFQFRKSRDAAHIDGLLKGNRNQRFALEYHDYILAISLSDGSCEASPFVVWEKSHKLMQQAFRSFYQQVEEKDVATTDIQAYYSSVRRRVFDVCKRVELPLKRGQAVVAHRMLLHGTAPWRNGAVDKKRVLCFFRPQNYGFNRWLSSD